MLPIHFMLLFVAITLPSSNESAITYRVPGDSLEDKVMKTV